MKYLFVCFFLLFISCSSTKNKIRIKNATISVVKNEDAVKLLGLDNSRLNLQKNENLLLLKFDIEYYGRKNPGLFSGGIEPGQDGIEKPLTSLNITDSAGKKYNSLFTGISVSKIEFENKPLCIGFAPTLDSLKSGINNNSKRYTGSNLDCYFLFKYDRESFPDTIKWKLQYN